MKNQGVTRFAAGKTLHPAEKDEVVTAWVLHFVDTFEPGRAAFDERYASDATARRHAVETIAIVRGGEAVGEVLLIGR